MFEALKQISHHILVLFIVYALFISLLAMNLGLEKRVLRSNIRSLKKEMVHLHNVFNVQKVTAAGEN